MNLVAKLLVISLLSFLSVAQCEAQRTTQVTHKQGMVLSDVPRKVDTKALYLFYISGYIVEAGNIRPTSPKFGVYEYEQILDAFKHSGFVVISEARQKSEELAPYAARVTEQVRQLLKAGVPPQNITIVGASQGGWMAMLVSTYLKNRDLKYVVVGACGADDGFLDQVDLHGSVLIIIEKSDRFPSSFCQRYRKDATGLVEYKEVETNTGQKHGFLYRPLKEWMAPTIEFAQTHSRVSARNRSLQ